VDGPGESRGGPDATVIARCVTVGPGRREWTRRVLNRVCRSTTSRPTPRGTPCCAHASRGTLRPAHASRGTPCCVHASRGTALRTRHAAPRAVRTRHAAPRALRTRVAAPRALRMRHAAPRAVRTRHAAPRAVRTRHAAPRALRTRHAAPRAVRTSRAAPRAVRTSRAAPHRRPPPSDARSVRASRIITSPPCRLAGLVMRSTRAPQPIPLRPAAHRPYGCNSANAGSAHVLMPPA
jgi:hypothetical protein